MTVKGTFSAAGAGSTSSVLGRGSVLSPLVATGSTVVPADNSIPQNNEGDQYMSLTYTPASATSFLVIQISVQLSVSLANTVTVALFQDSTANALSATSTQTTAVTQMQTITFSHVLTSGSTAPTTFTVRIGPATASTITFNGSNGTQRYGGVCASSILLTEYSS